jgi:glycosyltransferase involved in cell wall biosynthesis
MRVLFLQQQPCVRALKYAAALRSAYPSVRLGFAYQGTSLSARYGFGDELFEHWWKLGSKPMRGLRAAAEEFRPDLVHSHNLPDSLTVTALELFGDRVPVVHDVHDLQSLRRTPYEHGFPEPSDPLALERLALERCSALVAVSEELLDEIRARYSSSAPALAFPNYALAAALPSAVPPPDRPNGRPPHIVYQGTLSKNGGHYDLRDIFRAIVREGLYLDLYPSRPAPAYVELASKQTRMRVHATLPLPRLLAALTAYDFGWAGFNATLNRAHLDTCLPNKAYEYLGCGLPVLTLGHRALSRLIGDGCLGLSLATLDDLARQLADLDVVELRRRVQAARPLLTVEANIHHLVELYGEICGLDEPSTGSAAGHVIEGADR